MDKSESLSGVEDGKAPSAPGTRRTRWMVSLAVVAMAGAVVSLASLRGSTPESTTAAAPAVDLAALSQQSPLAVPLYNQLSTVAQVAAPVQQAAAAAPAAAVAPAAAPAAAKPDSMAAMSGSSTASTSSSSCISKESAAAFWAHIESAHLDQSPLQQVQGLLDLDNYVKLHTVWLETVLKPLLDGEAQQVGADSLTAFWAHVQSAHLDQSPLQQVQGLLNFDDYVKLHTVWLETVLKPTIDQLTC